jgi:excisionase family DNA binding protein
MSTHLYGIPDTAVRLGISQRKLAQLIAEGRIRSVKLDGRRLIPDEAIGDFIRSLSAA